MINDYLTFDWGLLGFYLVLAGSAYMAGRIFRNTSRSREARTRAADGVTFTRSDLGTVQQRGGHPDLGTDPGPHGHGNDDGAAFALARVRQAGRRTILRDNGGPRRGRHSAGGHPDGADAETLT